MTHHNQGRLLRASAVLVIATLIVGALIVGTTRLGGSTETPGAVLSEPYAPFRMTYITYDASGESITVELTWLSQLSWDAEVVAATEFPRQVGSYNKYHQGVMTSYSAIFNELRTEPTYDGSNGEFEIPAPWLLPRAFTAGDGWEPLGSDADGYDSFQRSFGEGAKRYHEIYRRDPRTGLVMEVVHMQGSQRTTVVKVLTCEPLGDAAPQPSQ